MIRFLAARAGQAVLVVFAVVTLSFTLAHVAPGDPFWAIDDPTMTETTRAELRTRWGFDQPVWKQYGLWLRNIGAGDLGWSHSRGRAVSAVLRDAVPNTLVLMTPAIAMGLLVGVVVGTLQAVFRGRMLAGLADGVTLTVASVPDFVVALAVLSLVAALGRPVPMSGMIDPVQHDAMSLAGRAWDVVRHMVAPAFTLALLVAATVSRYHRTAMLAVAGDEYLRTARAMGASERRVIVRHALRNALGPVVALGGLLIPAALAGAVFVEKTFAWPGMGLTVVDAVARRDYALVQAVVLVGALLVTAAGAAADIVAVWLNPRMHLEA